MLFLNELHKISETTYLNYLHSSSKFSTRSKSTNRKKIKKSGSKTPKTFKKIDKSSSVKKMRLSNQLGPKLKAHIKNIPAINTKSIEAYDVTQLILMFDLIDNISNHITTISPKDVEEFKNILFLRSFNNGIKHIVSYIKRCKVCILLITSGEIPEDINKLVGLPKTNNLGFPQRISFLAHIMHTETGIRELISLLNTFKVLIEKIDNKELNYSSIINPHQEHAVTGIEQLVLSDKLRYVRLFLELPKFSLEDVKTNTFPIIRKAGPNGQAILICHNEIFFEDNLNKCLEFIGDAPKASLLALQETYQSNYNKLSDSDKSKFCDSRLTTFADKGFKSRTVAIVRY